MTTLQKIKWPVLLALLPLGALAQENTISSGPTYFSNALFNTLLILIIVLLIVIVALGSALKNIAGSDMMVKLFKNKDKSTGAGKSALVVLLMLAGGYAMAQDAVPIVAAMRPDDGRIGGLDQFTFYFMLTVIATELIVAGVLVHTIKKIVWLAAPPVLAKPAKKPAGRIVDKLNAAVDISEEGSITLEHDYDGIRELDNNLPPWWKYGFYLTIVVAFVYMINYHLAHTSPLQKEEYVQSVARANAEIAEYMKSSANNVDENSVKLLTSPDALESGKSLFIANCVACHGKAGEGNVGPNLTDNYWLHGGGVKDIFKTIKYGWPDKGMKSWKEDFSPVQVAQLASYIRSLSGTNPPNAKEKQGELYAEQMPADSLTIAAPVKDSIH